MTRVRWLTPTEAGRRLNISRSMVLRLTDARPLRAVRTETGRRLIPVAAVEKLAAERAARRQRERQANYYGEQKCFTP